MRVNEIFYSLQGEGRFTGTPAVFLRLSGCNLSCPFCDTRHQFFTDFTEEMIVEKVSAYPTRHIVITGGEPTLQLTASLTDRLHKAGFFIQMETNGSMALPEGCSIDWITCSPKQGANIALQHIDELKVLYHGDGRTDLSIYDNIEAQEFRLQPLDTKDDARNKGILSQTVSFILQHPKWRLSLQTHKIIGVE